jgi:hypothetical protein
MFLLGVLMSVSFVSCGADDDDDDPYAGSPIVGTWQYGKDDSDTVITYTFKADGSFTYTYVYSDAPQDVYTEKGTFKYDGKNTLVLTITESPYKDKIGTSEEKIEVVENSYIVFDVYQKFYKK